MSLRLANGFPEEGETYRAGRITNTRFAVLHNFPGSAADRADFSGRRHIRELRIRFANPPNPMIHPVVVCHDRDIPERRTFRKHWTVKPFGPIFEVAAGSIVEPRKCARLDYSPTLEESGPTHCHQKEQRVMVARHAAEGWHIYMSRGLGEC